MQVKRNAKRIGGLWSLLTAALIIAAFQNCSSPSTHFESGRQNKDSNSQQLGGGGIDGKSYVHLGTCGSSAQVVDMRIVVSADLTVAQINRQNCQDLVAPYANHIQDILVRADFPDAIVYTPSAEILTLEANPATQKSINYYCRSSVVTPSVDVLIWTGSNGEIFGKVTQGDPLSTTGDLVVIQENPSVFSGSSGENSMKLTLNNGLAAVEYATADVPARENSALVCYNQAVIPPPSPSPAPTPLPAATTSAPFPPSNITFSQVPNSRYLKVSWTAGSGYDKCVIQYESDDAWYDLVGVDCNADMTTDSSIELPNFGWTRGNWSAVPVRLAEGSSESLNLIGGTPGQTNSRDDTVKPVANLGTLTCVVKAGSVTPTPDIDEDCDGNWDLRTITKICSSTLNSTQPGAPYTCPATMSCSGETTPFFDAVWTGPGTQNTYYSSTTCSGTPTYVNAKTYASSNDVSGTVPSLTENLLPIDEVGRCASDGSAYSYEVTSASTSWSPGKCQYAVFRYY